MLTTEQTVEKNEFYSQLEGQRRMIIASRDQMNEQLEAIDAKLALIDKEVNDGNAIDLRPVKPPAEEPLEG